MDENLILTIFSYLFIIWFVFAVVGQIFLSARGRRKTAKNLLYAGLIFSLTAALFLTFYMGYIHNALSLRFIFATFAGNFILWIAPVVIAFLIYFVYFRMKRYEFKEVTKEERRADKKAEKLKRYNEEYKAANDLNAENKEK
ncbi:MAG: hypothetical protein LBE57_07245 [Methanosarcinales archaeon]|jgi:uncharacterized membrane protein|nr:hypothetical protein [Methanosarcinales archaeon]